MAGLRFAVLITSSSRYLNLVIGLGVTMALSRLLTPADVGTILVGTNIALLSTSVRDFCSPIYLVQKTDLAGSDVSALAYAQIGLAALIGVALWALAPWAAAYFEYPDLARFLAIVALALQLEALALPGQALLQREMRFGALAVIVLAQTATQAIVAITLAYLGFGVLSLAYAWLANAATGAAVALYIKPPHWLRTPTSSGIGAAFAFGRYHGASSALARAQAAAMSTTVGRSLSLGDAGYFGRAQTLSQLTERLFVDIVLALALPSFSDHVRTTGDTLSRLYLRWLEIIAAVHWPGLALLIILADPIVAVLYGPQWQAVVPVVQIMVTAAFFSTPVLLAWPALVAAGGVRDRLVSNAITLPLAALVFILAAQFGLMAAAVGMLVVAPINVLVELTYVRRRIPLPWRDLAAALRIPLIATLATAVGPLVLVASLGRAPGFWAACIVALTGVCGWVTAIVFVRHPLRDELAHAALAVLQRFRIRQTLPDAMTTRHIRSEG